jgi:hypothetical protein
MGIKTLRLLDLIVEEGWIFRQATVRGSVMLCNARLARSGP